MIVRFRVNLGSIDAESLNLDCKSCQEGMALEVSEAVAEWLTSHGVAEQEIKGVAKAAAVRGVPPKEGSVEKATDDLKAYRDKQKGKSKDVATAE